MQISCYVRVHNIQRKINLTKCCIFICILNFKYRYKINNMSKQILIFTLFVLSSNSELLIHLQFLIIIVIKYLKSNVFGFIVLLYK